MNTLTVALGASLFFLLLTIISTAIDQRRFRNGIYLFLSLLCAFPALLILSYMEQKIVLVIFLILDVLLFLFATLALPLLLIANGFQMIKREGKSFKNILSLLFGIMIIVGESCFFYFLLAQKMAPFTMRIFALISLSVMYISFLFLSFLFYTWFMEIIPRRKTFNFIIVLGAGLNNGKVSKLLQDRLDKAIRVYKKDTTPSKFIVSGGKGSDEAISEAQAMKNYLLTQNIPESDIILEDKSTNTKENVLNSKKIMDSLMPSYHCAIVTNNYHVLRANLFAKKIGLNATGIGSKVAMYYWPSAMIREFIAIMFMHKFLFFGFWGLMCVVLLFG